MVLWVLGLSGVLAATPFVANPVEDVPEVAVSAAPSSGALRQLVRVELGPDRPPVWILAVHQTGDGAAGLTLLQSEDGARSFRRIGELGTGASGPDTVDLLAVDRDVAIVTSYATASSAPPDVHLRWLRHQPERDAFVLSKPQRIFSSKHSGGAYSGASVARDANGWLWVQAFRSTSQGESKVEVAVSIDGGRTFDGRKTLETLDIGQGRAGGRVLGLANQVISIYGADSGSRPLRFRLRANSESVGTWSPARDAFPDGLRGMALSVADDGIDGMHVVYVDQEERVFHRRLGEGVFGPSTLLEDQADAATQPAITRVGASLFVFYNRAYTTDEDHDWRVQVLRDGVFSGPAVLDPGESFKTRAIAADVLPSGLEDVPAFFVSAPHASLQERRLRRVIAQRTLVGDPTSGASRKRPVFVDTFDRASTPEGLGPNWRERLGLWRIHDRRARTELTTPSLVTLSHRSERDAAAELELDAARPHEAGVALRVQGRERRYELLVLADRTLRLYRVQDGVRVELGRADASIEKTAGSLRVKLEVSGSAPVRLVGSIDGEPLLRVNDGSPRALVGTGEVGLYANRAGASFRRFRLYRVGPSSPDAPRPKPDLREASGKIGAK